MHPGCWTFMLYSFAVCYMQSTAIGIMSRIFTFIKLLLPFQAAAWKVSSAPIKHMLDARDKEEKDRLTSLWRDNAIVQLNTISITSALFAGVIAASFTWPVFTRLSYYALSNIQAVWYSGLALALASIATSTQLAVALSRLGSHPDGLSNIREVLGTQGEDDVWRPSRLQLIIWQAPISLLNASVIFYIVGLVFVVISSVSPSSVKHDIKIVVLFILTLVYATGLYSLSAYGLYHRVKERNAAQQQLSATQQNSSGPVNGTV